MSISNDDPRLTAYALGELNAADRAAVEQQIGESVETLLEIEAIREVAGQLRAALGDESILGSKRDESSFDSSLLFGLKGREQTSPGQATIGSVALGNVGDEFVSPEGARQLLIETDRPRLAPSSSTPSSPTKVTGTIVVVASCLALTAIIAVGVQSNLSVANRRLNMISESDGVGTTRMLADVTSRPFGLNEDGDFGGDGEMLNEALVRSKVKRDSSRVLARSVNDQFYAANAEVALRERQHELRAELAQMNRPANAVEVERSRLNYHKGEVQGQVSSAIAGRKVSEGQALSKQLNEAVREKKLASEPVHDHLLGAVVPTATPPFPEALSQSLSSEGRPEDLRKAIDRLERFEREAERIVDESKRAEVKRHLALSRRWFEAMRLGQKFPALAPTMHDQIRKEQDRTSAEAYAAIHDNPFATPLEQPLSTFSIDVDTAAYSNMRRFLTQGSWPPADAVRIEELVNYFSYDYAPPTDAANPKSEISDLKSQISNQPFTTHLEVAACPWNADHRLVRVGLKGKEIALDKRPVSNIVFLIDVSGSMQDANKLPLVKAGLRRLIDQLHENDRVAIVVYAGASGLALDSTNATQKDVIISAIENLQAGGSTNGGEGIQLAYTMARKHFIPKGTNRVILCTDGDFNVGITDQEALTRLIEEEAKSGVFLSVLGFGMGNLKDATLEKLADKGNGHYAYIDSMREAHKVFVEQMTGTLIMIAKDVKIQIEFNPAAVGAYRLIGYENRVMAAQDFRDDTKDAGEIGAGHTVTALYEIIPPSKLPAQPKAPAAEEKLKYQPNVKSPAIGADRATGITPNRQAVAKSDISNLKSDISNLKSQISDGNNVGTELLTIKLRYKQPDADKSQLIEQPLTDEGHSFAQASTDFRFAASVASFGMILRHSPHRGNATLDAVAEIAGSSLGPDKAGHRAEFLGLVRSAKALMR